MKGLIKDTVKVVYGHPIVVIGIGVSIIIEKVIINYKEEVNNERKNDKNV